MVALRGGFMECVPRVTHGSVTTPRNSPKVVLRVVRLLELRCVVHGEHFTFLDFGENLELITERMGSWYSIKVRGRLTGETGSQTDIPILRRIVRWRDGVLEFEADPKRLKTLCEGVGVVRLGNGTPLATLDMDSNGGADRVAKISAAVVAVPPEAVAKFEECNELVRPTARWVATSTSAAGRQTERPFGTRMRHQRQPEPLQM